MLKRKSVPACSLLACATVLVAGQPAWAQDSTADAPAALAASANQFDDIVVTANRREEAIQSVPTAITAMNGEKIRELGITTASDLSGKVPGLMISSGGKQRSTETIVIRGQGMVNLGAVGVVNYFNEVPTLQGVVNGIQGAPGMFFDLENMQVLRGPQGTLFGKNTTGGAVLLGPKKPTDEFGGYVQGQIGNYKDREIEAALNVPIVNDVLAMRFSFKSVDRDGYTKDVGPKAYGLAGGLQFNSVCAAPSATIGSCVASPGFAGKDYDDRHFWHARVGILFRPTDSIENYTVAYYSKQHDNGTGFILDGLRGSGTNPNFPANPYDFSARTISGAAAYNVNNPGLPITLANRAQYTLIGNQVGNQLLSRQEQLGPRRTAMNTDQYGRTKSWGIVNALDIGLSDTLKLRSITGYQRLIQDFAWDLDGSILPQSSQIGAFQTAQALAEAPAGLVGKPGEKSHIDNLSQFSQELQLQGSAFDKKLQYAIGGFYSKTKPEGVTATGSFNTASRNAGTFYAITTQAKALYAQGTLDFGAFSDSLDGLRLTGGIRRTWDKITGSRYASNYVTYPVVLDRKVNSTATTWTAGLDYQINRGIMVYGKVTRGYKAGVFNYLHPNPALIAAEPEYVKSYEAGFKSDFRLGQMPVRFNVNGFIMDYTNIQRGAAYSLSNGCTGATPPARCALLGNTTGLDQGGSTFNAASARLKGLEAELYLRPVEGLELSGTYTFIDAKYKSFKQNILKDSLTSLIDTCDGTMTMPAGVTVSYDFSCIPFQNTPRNMFTLGAKYTAPLGGDNGDVSLTANYAWTDRMYASASTTPKDDPLGWVKAYGVLNMSVEWANVMGKPFDLRFFMTNVTDKTYRVYAYVGQQQASGFVNSIYGEPRMYGVSLRYRFGSDAD
jgi:iron complex outermembrane receptor protein